MNSTQREQLILLEQSGELSPKQRKQLDAELTASPEARRQRDALRTFACAIPPVEAEPSPDAAARIADRLQKPPAPASATVPRSLFHPIWKPALAAAAAMALLLGVRAYRPTIPPETGVATVIVEESDSDLWADPFEADFAELDSLITEAESNDLNTFMAL